MTFVRRGLLFSIVLSISLCAYADTIDCKEKSKKIETKICADEYVIELDRLLDTLERENPIPLEEDTDRVDEQPAAKKKAWLAKRDKCSSMSCVTTLYENSIKNLACNNNGSATGFSYCSSVELKFAKHELDRKEKLLILFLARQSDNQEYTERVFWKESKAWRSYVLDLCELHGALEGGSDGWKNAWADGCLVDETQKRIADIDLQLTAAKN